MDNRGQPTFTHYWNIKESWTSKVQALSTDVVCLCTYMYPYLATTFNLAQHPIWVCSWCRYCLQMKRPKELTIDQLLKSHIRMVFGLLKFHKTFLKLSTLTSTEGQIHFDKVLPSLGPIVSPVAHKFLSSCNHDPFIILTLNYNKGEGSLCCGLYT